MRASTHSSALAPAARHAASIACSHASRSGAFSATSRSTIRVASSSRSIRCAAFFPRFSLHLLVAQRLSQHHQLLNQFVKAPSRGDLFTKGAHFTRTKPAGNGPALVLQGIRSMSCTPRKQQF